MSYFGYFWSKRSETLKFGTKVGVKSINHFMTFFDSRPNNRFGRVLTFLAWFGYFGYFWSKRSGTLKFGTKKGGKVKSIFNFISFFDSRPNNRAIDLFAFVAKVHCNSLRAMETPKFLFCFGIGTPIPRQFQQKLPWDIILKLSLGANCPQGSCANYKMLPESNTNFLSKLF